MLQHCISGIHVSGYQNVHVLCCQCSTYTWLKLAIENFIMMSSRIGTPHLILSQMTNSWMVGWVRYKGKSLNNRNCILKCMEKYAQRKILFRDTKWLLSNMWYRGRDDQAVWACAVGRTTWPLHCQLAPWKSNEVLFVFCGQRVWNLLKSTEEWRFSMETVIWVRGECMNGWKDFKTDDKMSVMNTRVGEQLAWRDSETAGRAFF